MDGRSAVLGLVEMVDWNINFGNWLTIGVIVGGWAYTLIQMRTDVKDIKAKMESVASLITGSAVLSKRIDHAEDDIRDIRKEISELRHGEGFVRGARGIDREFP